MAAVDVPGELQSSGGPRAASGQVAQRKPVAGLVVRDLDVVALLPDRPRLQLDREARWIVGRQQPQESGRSRNQRAVEEVSTATSRTRLPKRPRGDEGITPLAGPGVMAPSTHDSRTQSTPQRDDAIQDTSWHRRPAESKPVGSRNPRGSPAHSTRVQAGRKRGDGDGRNNGPTPSRGRPMGDALGFGRARSRMAARADDGPDNAGAATRSSPDSRPSSYEPGHGSRGARSEKPARHNAAMPVA